MFPLLLKIDKNIFHLQRNDTLDEIVFEPYPTPLPKISNIENLLQKLLKDNFYHLIIITEVLKGYTTLATKIIVVKIIRNIK